MVVVLVAAFILLQPGKSDKPDATQTTTAPKPAFAQIRIRAGKPVGGIQKITIKKGDQARIEVSSPDTTDEIHLHGYDLKRDLKAGGSVRFSFEANADGIYEIELEKAGVQIGKLVIEP
jgi:heme/copper-type cytochrome/quinol oxidase subunit 2